MSPHVRTGLMVAGVVAALALFVGGFYAIDDDGRALPAEIERIVPPEGALISPQGDVGVDLADDHTGILSVDGTPVPITDATLVEPLSQIFFSPREGRFVERFEPGTHTASVTYWSKRSTAATASTFSWSFRVG